jgi:hypothetical protein
LGVHGFLDHRLGRFVRRDLGYILGGVSVVVSFLYLCDLLKCIDKDNTPIILFIIGIGYAIGYVIPEFFSIIGLATSADYFELNPDRLKCSDHGLKVDRKCGKWVKWFCNIPCQLRRARAWIVRCIYRLQTQKSWPEIDWFDQFERQIEINDLVHMGLIPETSIERHERIVVFMLFGNTMGSCFIVSGVLIAVHAIIHEPPYDYDWPLAIAGFFLGAILLCLGWVKAAQNTEFIAKLYSFAKSKKEEKGGETE